LAIDNSAGAAVYTGLAIVTPQCREFLAVANFHSGSVEPYTVDFAPLAPPGSFTDPNLPTELVFRNDGVGDPNTLYFTAGPNQQDRGLFGAIAFHN
jgi:hypothetical protein